MTFNAASRLRSLEDRSAALGSRRCELPGMHSVPKSAVLPYASGVGGLSRRLLNLMRCGAPPDARCSEDVLENLAVSLKLCLLDHGNELLSHSSAFICKI